MQSSKKQILSACLRVSLVLIYSCFFTVQLFFNFDTSNRFSANTAILKQVKSGYFGKQHSVATSKLPVSKSHSFRLNKRYHPQPAVSCSAYFFEQPEYFCNTRVLCGCRTRFISSRSIVSHALRGPPVIG
jgi:hypothetical protein